MLQNAPTSGAIARVRVQGISKVIANATLADGDLVATTVTTGRAKAAVAGTVSGSNAVGSYAMGRLLADGASGVATTMLIQPQGLIPTTLA